MTRNRYFLHVLRRLLEAAAIAATAALLTRALQAYGHQRPPVPPSSWGSLARWATVPLSWLWPALAAICAHVVLGPKQRRPVYLRVPGAMYCYAGIRVDRNAGCRGGCVTGATGSGKTLSCIVPRLHSLCVNEAGVENPGWRTSPEQRQLEREADSGTANTCEFARRARRRRYKAAPWGGFICGEKGNEWGMVERLLRCHARAGDLCVLRTRPADAPAGWRPPERLNLLSMDDLPADTYAKLIVETGLATEEAKSRDEFFIPQARDKIAWGLRLVRAVAEGRRSPPGPGVPSFGLLTLLDILTVQESYRRYLLDCTAEDPSLEKSGAFAEARYQLENNYWSQPPDQLGGVRSTIYNFLVPFSEPEIAEVFCADSTLDLREVQEGRVVTLAIPQKFAVQRRYVATLIKSMVYQIVLGRFDRGPEDPGWLARNVVLVEQDEWQRHAVAADCDVDIVREANGAVYAATQSQNAVWLKLGGREKAAPLIANLRNRWVCQAATEECADESSALVSARISREVSYSRGNGGSTTNVSFSERPLLPKREIRSLRPFHVVFAPAEGAWHYRKCIAMPATPDGEIPHWWFGDWNPLHWVAHAFGAPERLAGVRLHRGPRHVLPWRAAAPLRAQARWILGLDGTFIVLGGRRTGADGD